MLGMLFKIAAFVVVAHFVVRFLLRVFNRQGRVYYLTPARQFKLVFWSLISFWLALVMFGLLLREHTDTHLERILAIALGGILFLFSLPTLLVHFQYWRHERESALELEKDTRTALLLRPGQKYLLQQSQIRHILETRCSSKSVFWKDYGYLTLTLQDGRAVTITSLLIDLNQLKALWPYVPLQTRTKWVCFL
ncbi:hypothetical protein [Rufibacter quisquiliarum]|uniref:PH domain-containing protein n=1 Tax=Rufibacter quisquiliarum TaxID=1549639 RepID=A0A839GS62_9BACT|nr:hypothetical protein [Rufibacter quisquiliarum]MBA9077707.1 hypothetical protein [Rufibacter quisquiliarum]